MSTILISRYKEETFKGSEYNGQVSGFGFVAAVFLHIGLLLIMVFMQQCAPPIRKLPSSVQVDLVSYTPKLEDLLKSDKKQPKKVVTKEPDKRVKPKPVKKHIKKYIKKPVEKKEKEFSEKKVPDPVKEIETAKEDIKKRVDEQEQNKIRDILSELSEKVAEQEMEDDYEEEEDQTSSFKAWKKGDNTATGIYHGILAATVQQNWVFNERLAKLSKLSVNNEKLEVRVVIKILMNGDLGDIWIETKSGNDFLDKSAIRAIKKAAPFPPLPKEFRRSSYELGLLFSRTGLK